jgi:hypothetical protein
MNQEYEVAITTPSMQDIEKIRADIASYSSEDDSNAWEDGIFDVIRSLHIVAHYQESEPESQKMGFPVRKILYKQKGTKRQYHLFFTIDYYPKPAIEPTHPYAVGIVKIIAVRYATQNTMTKKEIQSRLDRANADLDEPKYP